RRHVVAAARFHLSFRASSADVAEPACARIDVDVARHAACLVLCAQTYAPRGDPAGRRHFDDAGAVAQNEFTAAPYQTTGATRRCQTARAVRLARRTAIMCAPRCAMWHIAAGELSTRLSRRQLRGRVQARRALPHPAPS